MRTNQRNRTSDWELNENFYNIVKQRFADLKKKLEGNLKEKETLKFECPKCKNIFALEKATRTNYQCPSCDDKTSLIAREAQ